MPIHRRVIVSFLVIGAAALIVSCKPAGSGGSAASNHPAIGHWQGTISTDNGRDHHAAILVDSSQAPLRSALMFFNLGANYTDCTDVTAGENELSFFFSRGKYDFHFEMALAADGQTMTGTMTAQEGNKSNINSATMELQRMPRATDVSGFMKFSQYFEDDTRGYTLTITLAQTETGEWVGIYEVPERSLENMTLFDMTEENGTIRGTSRTFGPPQVFTMTLSSDQRRLTGTWGQVELDMSRSN